MSTDLRHTIPSLLSGSLRPAAENANRHCDALRVIGKIWKYPTALRESNLAGKSSISRWLSDYPSNSWDPPFRKRDFPAIPAAWTGLALVLWSSDASATPMPGRSQPFGGVTGRFSRWAKLLFRGRGALQEYRFSGVRQLSCWMLLEHLKKSMIVANKRATYMA